MFVRIPLIDVSPLLKKWDHPNITQDECVAQVVTQIDQACREAGFFYVQKGHGIPDSLMKDIKNIAREYFHQLYEEKIKIKLSAETGYRGYQIIGENITIGIPDIHEAIDIEETSFDRLCQSKKILTVNGRFPGPTIYARAGETLSLDVENRGKDNVTMFCCRRVGRHVKSDQVEWLVAAGSTVRKNITISDDEEGTLWWHAMNLWQRATVHGAFIVHPKPGKPDDHIDIPIILGEWWKKDVKEVFLDYIDSGSDIKSDAFTINGQPGDFYPCSNNGTFRIVVDAGKKYLLRIVNAAIRKKLYFGIASHKLTIIAMDGSPLTKPFTTEFVELSVDDSIDCIFEANQHPDYYYYMVVVTNLSNTYEKNKVTTAIIEYQGNYIPSSPPLLPNFSLNYDKSSSRDDLYVIMAFVILGLLFCTTFVHWYRQTNMAHRSAMVTPL